MTAKKPHDLQHVRAGMVDRPVPKWPESPIAEAAYRGAEMSTDEWAKRSRMIEELLVMFDVPPSSFEKDDLILAMADAFVPGFVVHAPRGRPRGSKVWTNKILAYLAWDAEHEQTHAPRPLTQKAVVARLAKRAPWIEMLDPDKDGSAALTKHLQDAKSNEESLAILCKLRALSTDLEPAEWIRLMCMMTKTVRRKKRPGEK